MSGRGKDAWIVYRLNVSPGEHDNDSRDYDEWFTSLRAAKARRAQLIAVTDVKDYRYGRDFEIERVGVAKAPPMELILRLLRRMHWRAGCEVVVPAYVPPAEAEDE